MLTTIADIKTRFDLSGTGHDAMLTAVLGAANDAALKYLDRTTVEAANITEYYDGHGINKLMLRNWPVNSVASLYDDTDLDFAADTLIAADDYTVFEDEGMILLAGFIFADGTRNVKVTYNAGYSAGEIPAAIVKAVQNLTLADYIEGLSQINAIEAADFVYRPDKLRKEAFKMLDSYKRFA